MSMGKGALIAFKVRKPPRASAGKNFKMDNSYSTARVKSEGVQAPGNTGILLSRQYFTTLGLNPGETINRAPLSTANFA